MTSTKKMDNSALGNLTSVDFLLKYGKLPVHNGQRQFPTLQQGNNNKSDRNFFCFGCS